MIEVKDLPAVNACLNGLTSLLLVIGYVQVKSGKKEAHRVTMSLALLTSAIFLAGYLTYHFFHGATKFPRHDWTRPVYFTVLISHTFLAMVNLPLIIGAVVHAVRGDFERHKKFTRWAWPVWMYVSVTGVLIYFMLYHWWRA